MRTESATSSTLNTTELLSALVSFKNGDFSARLPADKTGVGGKVYDVLNEIFAQNQRMTEEVARVSVVNLRVGIPEEPRAVAAEDHVLSYIILTAEPGVIGGMPTGGPDFGSAINGDAILEQPAQFDFYDGGGLDAAFLGMAQADAQGNVNVSRFGPKLAGSGGFINISQNAKKVVFLGTFLAPCRTEVVDGHIAVDDAVAAPKFLDCVEQRTFSGSYAAGAGQPVLYVTERCVFRLTQAGLQLIEIAPGIDLERDVLAHVGFTPIIDGEPKLMDTRIFCDEPMGLKDDLLTVPLEARFTYDAGRNIFFLNLEGMSLNTDGEADAIAAEIEKRLAAVGKKVPVAVNYDNFYLAPDLADKYASVVRGLAERYYESVTRYTTSSFMRLKLSGHLTERGLAPHIYESRQEALDWLKRQGPQ